MPNAISLKIFYELSLPLLKLEVSKTEIMRILDDSFVELVFIRFVLVFVSCRLLQNSIFCEVTK